MKQTVRNEFVSCDINQVWENKFISWQELKGKTVLVTGATGNIGSFIVRCLLYASDKGALDLKLIISSRSVEKLQYVFADELLRYGEKLMVYAADVRNPMIISGKVDYIIHAASHTSSAIFVERPAETREIIVEGTRKVLEFAREKKVKGMVFLSSMEALGDVHIADKLGEAELGGIDEKRPRNSYPLGKREAEGLCTEYAQKYGVPVRTARLSQVIGANANFEDERVYAMFARCVVGSKDIVLKTSGQSLMSSCYITDAVNGILLLLFKGNNGEVYHIANEKSARKIADVAAMLVDKYTTSKLRWEIKDENLYPATTCWNLCTEKIEMLGWQAQVSLEESYNRLISSFLQQYKECNQC